MLIRLLQRDTRCRSGRLPDRAGGSRLTDERDGLPSPVGHRTSVEGPGKADGQLDKLEIGRAGPGSHVVVCAETATVEADSATPETRVQPWGAPPTTTTMV